SRTEAGCGRLVRSRGERPHRLRDRVAVGGAANPDESGDLGLDGRDRSGESRTEARELRLIRGAGSLDGQQRSRSRLSYRRPVRSRTDPGSPDGVRHHDLDGDQPADYLRRLRPTFGAGIWIASADYSGLRDLERAALEGVALERARLCPLLNRSRHVLAPS